MNILFAILTFISIWFAEPQEKYIGGVRIYVNESTGDVRYEVDNSEYLVDRCHVMTYISMRAMDQCGVQGMLYYMELIEMQEEAAAKNNLQKDKRLKKI